MKPTSKTAVFCCGARMIDAESIKPICGDNFAKVFMDHETLEIFGHFKEFKNAIISNATRHRIIDDMLKRELAHSPDKTIILIGSGFDTRSYRLNGGKWLEFDDPQLIMHKNNSLPITQCKNSLKRIPYDYEKDSLSAKLSEFRTRKQVIVIIEGVFIYLDEGVTRKLLETLQQIFPNHILLCDLQTLSFFKAFNRKFQKVLSQLGSPLKIRSDNPEAIFFDAGYTIKEKISILNKTMVYAQLSFSQIVVKLILNTVYKNIKDGYTVYNFNYCK